MSLKHAILGFLNNGPKTGYDLQKKIESTISHFWSSTQSQIYRTLKDLSADEMILPEIEYQQDKPNKKVYMITDKGKQELGSWLSSPLETPSHRNPFLIQLFFSKDIKKEVVISNLNFYKSEMEARLSFLKSNEVISMMRTEAPFEKTLFELIRNNGIEALKSEIKWADESIKLLEEV